MRINHNIAALNTHRQLNSASNAQSNSMEKLSSGLRINKAGDDAAGLAISEKMRGQIRGLDMASKNAQDGISMIATAEGALNETHDILQRMRELSVQGSNDTMQDADRKAIGDELLALKDEIDRIATTTQFNGKNLLDGSLSTTQKTSTSTLKVGATLTTADATTVSKIDVSGADANKTYTFGTTANADELTLSDGTKTQTIKVKDMTANGNQTLNFSELGVSVELVAGDTVTNDTAANIIKDLATASSELTIDTNTGDTAAKFAIGANAGQTMSVSFSDMSSSQLGKSSNLAALITDNNAVSTVAQSQTLITEIDGAIEDVSTQRGKFGAAQNRLEHTINNLNTSSENLTAAESRIRDVDYALAA